MSHPTYRADIDGLRAVAVLSVIAFHAFPKNFPGGFIGVDVFFVISGFLISSIIYSGLEQGRFNYAEFYARRIRRIFPALILVLAVSCSFGWFALLADEYKQLGGHVAGAAGFASNFVLWGQSGYFDNSAATKPLLHLWSLAIEEQFYIVWPVLLALAWVKTSKLPYIIVAIAVISLAVSVYQTPLDRTAGFYSPISRSWELMTGSLLAHLTLHQPHRIDRYKNAQSIIGLSMLLFGLVAIDDEQPFPGWRALLPTMGAFLVISAGKNAWLNKYLLSSRVLVWVGLISYPLYLWHWPLLSFARIIESAKPTYPATAVLILASFLLAWLTFKLIESPVRFGKHGTMKTLALLVMMIVVGAAGFNIYKEDGVASRAVLAHSINEKISSQFSGPHWPYMSNEECLRRYPFKEAQTYKWWFCIASPPERPTLLVLGNSYANQLYPGLITQQSLNHHGILSIGTCDPAKVDVSSLTMHGPAGPCSGERPLRQQELIDGIIERHPSIRFVILAGLHRNPDADYIERLRQRIDFLERQQIRVIVFIPMLEVDYDIKACFPRPLKRPKVSCLLDTTERERVLADFQPLIDRLSATNPGVNFFDQNALFCNDATCSLIHNGMPLFRDKFHHLSEYGSIELARIFSAWTAERIPELLATKSSRILD